MKPVEQAAMALFNDRSLKGRIRPENGQPLAGESPVAFRVPQTRTMLFTEPDDPAESPRSVAGFLMWMEMNHVGVRVHLIHPIGSGNDDTALLAYYLGYRIELFHHNFVYHPFRVQDWDDEGWISELLSVARFIVREDLHESETEM